MSGADEVGDGFIEVGGGELFGGLDILVSLGDAAADFGEAKHLGLGGGVGFGFEGAIVEFAGEENLGLGEEEIFLIDPEFELERAFGAGEDVTILAIEVLAVGFGKVAGSV